MKGCTPPISVPLGRFEYTGVKILLVIFLNKELC